MITIDDPETERLARELAARNGESVEAVVRAAVRAQVAAAPARALGQGDQEQASPEEQARRRAILLDVARRMDALPELDTRSADEIIGYDENGLPT